MLADPPEAGNEDEAFGVLLDRARAATSRPVLIIAADPPRRDDTAQVQQDKAIAVAEAWAERQGAVFGGIIPCNTASRARKIPAAGRGAAA